MLASRSLVSTAQRPPCTHSSSLPSPLTASHHPACLRATRHCVARYSVYNWATGKSAHYWELEQELEHFKQFDQDRSGSLNLSELQALLETTEHARHVSPRHWMSHALVSDVMRRYDLDGSGDLNLSEFHHMLSQHPSLLLDGRMEEYEEVFYALDTAKRGSVGMQQVVELLKGMGMKVQLDAIFEFFQVEDKHDDGRLDFGAFVELFRWRLLYIEDVSKFLSWRNALDPSYEPHCTSLVPIQTGHVSLLSSEVELNDLLEHYPRSLVVLYVSHSKDEACCALQDSYQKLAQQYPDVVFVQLFRNMGPNQWRLAQSLRARSTPAFCLFAWGKCILLSSTTSGYQLEDDIRRVLAQWRARQGLDAYTASQGTHPLLPADHVLLQDFAWEQ